ncbi:MAG TPA: alpha/beta fold hydrolase [Candidatus Dormibacteraeota bacterium]|nr:alpha/beta fold hydrolase [Candidatus Dormibacteraeota bacterium]
MAKNGAVKTLLGLLLVIALLVGGAYALLYGVTHPPREKTQLDPADLLLRAEDVTFHAADGVLLSGWLVKGTPRAPVIVLCHDLGGSRSALLNSAVSLNRAGYALLVFDFRGHGLSMGSGGYLGVDEKSDILGAIAFLKSRSDVDGSRVGLWGIGMGAYAGTLAAIDSPEIVALALDSLYPDVTSQLERLVRARIPPPLSFVMPVLHQIYRPYLALRPPGNTSLSTSLGALSGRNVLLIVAIDSPERYNEEKALYAALPEGPQGGKSLLELKASVVTGLYAEDKKTYDQAIVRFFTTNLPKNGGAKPPAKKGLQVLER